MKNIINKMEELNKKLKNWAIEYYENDSPSVSDAVYDGHYIELVSLESDYPELVLKETITQKIGWGINNKFTKVKHSSNVLSLDNAFNKNDLLEFNKRINNTLGISIDFKFTIEEKIDGISISLIYKNGILNKAVTRGDGTIGEDVTNNVIGILDVPKRIKYFQDLEVRGEIFMYDEEFKRINSISEKKYANSRNLTAGTIRQLDSKIMKQRKVSTFFYHLVDPENHNISSHSDSLDFIKNLGFRVNERIKLVLNIEEAFSIVKFFEESKKDLNYPIDGAVIKVDDINLWEDIGYTVKFPRFMIAYKFAEETAVTILKDIIQTIGRTGRVTYNAVLETTRIAGTLVRAATLHNADYIRELNLAVGDKVVIKKAAEIIPKVVSIHKKINNIKWIEDYECVSCSQTLIRFPNEVDQYCINENCKEINVQKLSHFVGRNAKNIIGLSIEQIRKFISLGFLTDLYSIYQLKNFKDKIVLLKGFKNKSVNKILNSIENSKSNEFYRFIFGLGIRHLGLKTSKILSKRFVNLETIRNLKYEELISIRDFGDSVSKSIIEYFKNDENNKMIDRFIEIGINMKDNSVIFSNILEGKIFVITGTLNKSRTFYKDFIESNGGNVSSSVSKNTTFILAGENPGTKKIKAEKLGIDILDELTLKEMVGK
ncbi:MAG: NAD-dependent DNA ligase LigA [Mollicutes bacterium PWAP]|nr:NAD-dependent DNA ligase LigA [Mollicutes bacterium PWAP]